MSLSPCVGEEQGIEIDVIWRERITKGQCAKEIPSLSFDQVRDCEDLWIFRRHLD